MKTDTINKLQNTMMLIENSLSEENPCYLTGITVQSGKNRYVIKTGSHDSPEGAVYSIHFPGSKIAGLYPTIVGFVATEVGKYDEASFIFTSKTETIEISVDTRGLKINKKSKDLTGGLDVMTSSHQEFGVSTNREYFVKISQASELLQEIGIIDSHLKVRNDMIRKYNQIDRFVEFADDIIKRLGNISSLEVLDCACGKSYLSFVLNFYVREILKRGCHVTGLDISEGVIEASRKTAQHLNYQDMKFMVADLREYRHIGQRPDLCISLHACDIATDYAIYTGIVNNARAILCVPCCHKELLTSDYRIPELSQSIFRNGLFKARFSDLMTDAIRVLTLEACGYDVRVTEYISPLDSPKNLLISAFYTGRKNQKSIQELKSLQNQFKMDLTLTKLLEKELGI